MPKTYRCPLCNKDHSYNDICPLLFPRIEAYKKKKSKEKIYIWGNIILACIEKNVDFRYIIHEIEVLESVLRFHRDSSFHDVDLITDYYSAALNVSEKRFFKSAESTVKGLMQYLQCDHDSNYEKDEKGNVLCFTLNVSLSNNKGLTLPDNEDELYILKEKKDGTWHYSLIYCPSIYTRYIDLEEETKKFDFLSMETTGIVMAEDVDGILEQYFETNSTLLWMNTAEQSDFNDIRFKKWTDLLIQQTVNNRIKWTIHKSFLGANIYETYLGPNEVRLITNNNADYKGGSYYLCNESLYIRDGEWGGLAFGSARYVQYELFSDQSKELPASSSNPILLRLEDLAKKNIASFEDRSFVHKTPEKKLTYSDCIVVCRSLICHKNGHRIQPYKGIVSIITADGKIIPYEIYVGYCKSCYRYLIFQDDYQEMRKIGTPLCKVIEEETDESDNSSVRFKYRAESILHAMGYTVNAKDSLPDEDRHKILDNCIDSGLLQINDVVEFLNWLIVTRSPGPQYERAIGLWREDLSFLENKYASDKIGISSIKAKKPRK